MPNCPKCGCPMTGGAPHGPWPIQYECHRCGTIVVPPRSRCESIPLAEQLLGLLLADHLAGLLPTGGEPQ